MTAFAFFLLAAQDSAKRPDLVPGDARPVEFADARRQRRESGAKITQVRMSPRAGIERGRV